jgi:nucleoside-diphosphate-sugar epimerase
MQEIPLLLLGVGPVAMAVLRAAGKDRKVYGTTRQPMRVFELFHEGLEPIVMPIAVAEIIEPLARGAHVLASFPPDGSTDAILAPACRSAAKIVYISSTSVYGNVRGKVDDTTPVCHDDPGSALRLEAEQTWRDAGAIVLRAPGIYGKHGGLHTRLKEGSYRIPGDGTGVISRIHVDDLAAIIIAALERGTPKTTFAVADLAPVPQIEVINWLCNKMNVPVPDSIPLSEAPSHLRASREVDPSKALAELGVNLKYPSYREGFADCLES